MNRFEAMLASHPGGRNGKGIYADILQSVTPPDSADIVGVIAHGVTRKRFLFPTIGPVFTPPNTIRLISNKGVWAHLSDMEEDEAFFSRLLRVPWSHEFVYK